MTETMPTSEVLNRAADLIEERGWTQGDAGWGANGDGPSLCLEGGIIAALSIEADDILTNKGRAIFRACPAYRAVSEYLDEWSLFSWNDRRARTASEVIEALRACAVIEASRERESAEVSA